MATRLTQIKAAAGAGKTYTLTNYFLDLLSGAQENSDLPVCSLARSQGPYTWQEILAVTFTNKAAAEMKERILTTLKKNVLDKKKVAQEDSAPETLKASAKASAWVNLILRHYGSLNVRTIDSLLTLLVRLSCLNFGLSPDFKTVFAPDEYFDPAFDSLLQEARALRQGALTPQGTALTHETACLLEEELRKCCRTLLWDKSLKGFAYTKALRDRLQKLTVHQLKQGANPSLATPEEIMATANGLLVALKEKALALQVLIEKHALTSVVHRHFANFLQKIEILPSSSREIPASVYLNKTCFADCCSKFASDLPEDLELAFEQLKQAYAAARNFSVLRTSRLNVSFGRLASIMVERLEQQFRAESFVPQDLIALLAAKLLADEPGPTESFCRLGARLRHILIDEFQDTNPEQWAAILPLAVECLASGGSLTCVGDTKQAIYGWRGGDASLFEQVFKDPELLAIAEKAEKKELPCNWRSWPAIVKHNNLVFSRLGDLKVSLELVQNVLSDDAPGSVIAETASALQQTFKSAKQLLPLEWHTLQEKRLEGDEADAAALGLDFFDNPGLVSLTCLKEKDDSALKERTRHHLHNLLLNDLLTRRPPSDIALLVRNRADASLLADWLTEWDIPVITENSLRLNRHPVLRQAVALLNWLAAPQNETALFEFICGQELFGRLSGLEIGEIDAWVVSRNKRRPLQVALRKEWPDVWERCLAPFYSQAGLMTPYDLVCAIFGHYGLLNQPETLNKSLNKTECDLTLDSGQEADDLVFVLRFLELLHGLEGNNFATLPAFCEWWEQYGEAQKIPMPQSLDAVQILTMHKAKGLEFPVVIVPFHNEVIKVDSALVNCEIEGLQVLATLRKDLGEEYYQAVAKRLLEAVNLLYVTWTRAVQELYVLIPRRQRAQTDALDYKILDVLLEHFKIDEDGAEHRTGKVPPHTAVKAPEAIGPQTANEEPLAGRPEQRDQMKQVAQPGEIIQMIQNTETLKRPMHWLPRLKIFRNNLVDLSARSAFNLPQDKQAEEPSLFSLSPTERGIFMHYCLEALSALACTANPKQMPALAFAWAERKGLWPEQELARLKPEALENLSWFLNLPKALHWLQNGRAEQSIVDTNGELHRADLVVFGKEGCTVLEYKTGDDVLENSAHKHQLQRYLRLLQEACGLPALGYLIYLDRRKALSVEI